MSSYPLPQFSIGPDDFALVMGILNKNLAEGQLEVVEAESPSASGGEVPPAEGGAAAASDVKSGEGLSVISIYI